MQQANLCVSFRKKYWDLSDKSAMQQTVLAREPFRPVNHATNSPGTPHHPACCFACKLTCAKLQWLMRIYCIVVVHHVCLCSLHMLQVFQKIQKRLSYGLSKNSAQQLEQRLAKQYEEYLHTVNTTAGVFRDTIAAQVYDPLAPRFAITSCHPSSSSKQAAVIELRPAVTCISSCTKVSASLLLFEMSVSLIRFNCTYSDDVSRNVGSVGNIRCAFPLGTYKTQ